MPKELTITVDDLKVVFEEWLDQDTEDCASLDESDTCAEWVFDRLQTNTLAQICDGG